jgi:hypothetical protein
VRNFRTHIDVFELGKDVVPIPQKLNDKIGDFIQFVKIMVRAGIGEASPRRLINWTAGDEGYHIRARELNAHGKAHWRIPPSPLLFVSRNLCLQISKAQSPS